jgi:hypothetical protein
LKPAIQNLSRASLVLTLCLIVLASCAHPHRVSRRTLQRLTKQHQPFVLVFGSLSTPTGTLAHPAIRFVHQANRSAPEYVLWSLAISSGDRFYAVLQPPAKLFYLDEFYVEVGDANTGFDRIIYIRLQQSPTPQAMYVGEIRMSPAQNRSAQGQSIVVNLQDDFQNAEKELKRLYPHFQGSIVEAALLRNPVPMTIAPGRVR